MADEEVALKHLKSRVDCTKRNHGYYASGVNIECLKTAIKALEKQTPRKLIHITRNEHCEKVIGYGCPACKTDVTGSGFYCWKCGQALDWSDEK